MAKQHLTEMEQTYNELCGIAMTNIFTITKNCDTIPFWCVNMNDTEHLFFISVGLALGGAIDKRIAVDGSRYFVWKLNRKLGLKKKEAKIIRMNGKDAMYAINPGMMVLDMKKIAKEKCGKLFTFGDIYREFYERKKK